MSVVAAHVGADYRRLAARGPYPVRVGLGRLQVDVGDQRLRALLGQPPRRGAADPESASRDYGHLSI